MSNRSFFATWLKCFLLLFAVATLLFMPISLAIENDRLAVLNARQQTRLNSAQESILSAFRERLGDAFVLANAPSVQRYLRLHGEHERQSTIQTFQAVCRSYSSYDQVRLIAADGRELVRINNVDGSCVNVPQAQLQNKADRYYFKEAIKLPPDQIYSSALDLNVEQGQIEQPLKPMIRFAVPVQTDQTTVNAGVVVLNYRAGDLLDDLFMHTEHGSTAIGQHFDFLVNRDGYYLRNEVNPEQQFGFMFGRDQFRFDQAYPDVWQAAQQGESSVENKAGLFLIRSVAVPTTTAIAAADISMASKGSNRWYLFSLIPKNMLNRESLIYGPYALLWALLYLLVLTVISALWAERIVHLRQSRLTTAEMVNTMTAIEAAGFGVHWIDYASGQILRANQNTLDQLHYDEQELLKLHIWDIDPQLTKEQFDQQKVQVRAQGYAYFETQHLTRQKGSLFVDVMITYRPATADLAEHFVGMAHDITDRKAAEDRFAQRHKENSLILSSSANGIYGVDMQGKTTFMNPAAEKMLGWPNGGLIGKNQHDLIHHSYEDGEPYAVKDCGIYAALHDGKTHRCDSEVFWRQDGSSFPVNYVSAPMIENGEITGAVVVFSDISDRIEAQKREEMLRKEEKSLLSLFDKGDAVLFKWRNDEHWSVDYVSENVARAIGYSRQQFLTGEKVYAHCIVAEDLPRVMAEVEEAVARQLDFFTHQPYRLVDAKGDLHWILDHTVVQKNETGQATHFIGYLTDITEQKQYETQLKKMNDQLSQAQEIANLAIWELDLVEDRLDWSHEVYKIFELPFDQSPNYQLFLDAIHPDDRALVQDAYQKSLVTQEPYQITHRLLMNDGRVKYVKEQCKTEYDDLGRAQRSIGTVYEITDVFELAQEVERERARYKNLMTMASDGLFVIEPESGRLSEYSRAVTQLLGYTDEEMARLTVVDWDREFVSLDQFRSFAKCIGLEPVYFERTHTRKDGSCYDAAISAVRIAINDSEYLYASVRDISAQKKNERELAQAKLVAEQASEAKSEFLSTVSHELRTPLNAIINSAYLLGHSDLNEEQQGDIETISVSSKNLLVLLNDTLDFAKIEAGRLELDPHPFSLDELVRDLWLQFSPACRSKRLDLQIHQQDGLPPYLIGDSNRLRQMLINLLSNAIKFTSEGVIALDVQLLEQRDDQSLEQRDDQVRLKLSVRDSGIGMSPEVQQKLFTPFTQADMSTSRHYGGTGLGLSIVSRLCTLMNGSIAVASQPGEGSTFSLEIPLQVTQEPGLTDAQSIVGERPLDGLKILAVDDSLINLKVLERLLQRYGAAATLCTSAQDALDLLQQQAKTFDLILMDVQMPEMNGREATVNIRRKLKLDIPVIALTGGVTNFEQDRALQSGMNDFLAKPVEPAKLVNTVLAYVKQQASASAEAEAEQLCALETADSWPQLDAIDQRKAQQMLGDDSDFFRQMLSMFVAETSAVATQLQQLIAETDTPAAARLVHKVRGQAGQIGATALFDAASRLEDDLNQKQQALPDLQSDFVAQLERLISEIVALGQR